MTLRSVPLTMSSFSRFSKSETTTSYKSMTQEQLQLQSIEKRPTYSQSPIKTVDWNDGLEVITLELFYRSRWCCVPVLI